MKVLVVEDSRAVRERLVSRIREIETVRTVAEAENVATALDAFEEIAPDLVILDLNLPGRSGVELLPILKTRVAPLVVVVLTNHTGSEYARRCRDLGADFFFDKSNEFQNAVDVVRNASEALSGEALVVGRTPTEPAATRPTIRSGPRRHVPTYGVNKK